MRKGVKIGIIAAIVIVVGAGAYYLASPLFISTEVDEPLPTTALESEAYQRFVSMNEQEKMQAAKQMSTQERDEIMAIASKVNNSVDEPMDQVQQQTQDNAATITNAPRTGNFVGVGDGIHNAEGTARVIPLQNDSNILRLEDLRITNGPDLYVYLSADKSASDYVSLGKLKANIGNQNYDIPTETDLTKYDTVLIWCRPFSVLFGSAELEVTS